MSRQFKQLPYFAIKAADEGRVRKGICAVFGNVDAWGDRIMPGAFAKTISEGRDRVKHLWNHSFNEVPIAKITELKEVGRDELPDEILQYAPDALGGLMVSREYLNSEKASSVLEALDAGVITEMSFAYDVIQATEITVDKAVVRELRELKLMDTSDVIWGMNPATLAVGAKGELIPLGILVQNLTFYTEEFKAGRRNANSDEKLLDAIHQASVDLGCNKCLGIKEEEDSKQAEAVFIDTSLLANRINLAKAHSLTMR